MPSAPGKNFCKQYSAISFQDSRTICRKSQTQFPGKKRNYYLCGLLNLPRECCRSAKHLNKITTYWKLSIRLCLGFILNAVALFDSVNTALSSWAAACCLALSCSSRAFSKNEDDCTGLFKGSLVPLKQWTNHTLKYVYIALTLNISFIRLDRNGYQVNDNPTCINP